MRIAGIVFAIFALLFGLRLVVTALQTAVSGKILVRRGGIRAKWQSAPTRNDAFKVAFRDGLMGLLLIALGIALLSP